jgi:DNA-directed RNA polymerase subunit RPC12/RpoP
MTPPSRYSFDAHYVYERCHTCGTVYRWPEQGLPRWRARCPLCGGRMYPTSASWTGPIVTLEHQP